MGQTLQQAARPVAFSAGLALVIVLLAFMALDVVRQIERLARANSDNVQWQLSQVEVEFLRLEQAAADVAPGDAATLAELRRRFDIFYGRSDTLANSAIFADLRAEVEFQAGVSRIRAALDRAIPVIDGPDAALAAAAPALAVEFEALHGEIRELGLMGIAFFAARSDDTRTAIAATLKRIATLTAFLILALTLSVLLMWQVSKRARLHEQEARVSAARMSAVVTTSLDGVVVSDGSGRIREFNGAAEQIFGWRRAEVLGQRIGDIIVPDDLRAAHETGMARYLRSGRKRILDGGRTQLEAVRRSGERFPVELAIASSTDIDGEPILVSFLRDITRRVAAEAELRTARDNALAGERAKDELLTVMSHEMRTPLNGMLATLELLDDTGLDERQRGYSEIIRRSGAILLQHVNDVLDISKLDAGTVSEACQLFDLAALMRSVADGQRALARRQNSEIHVDVPDGPMPVSGHPDGVRQILFNLVGNAVKFTENGRIDLGVARLGATDTVEIVVADTGPGIAPADQKKIFEDFVTLDSSYGRRTSGTGLGLGIVRRRLAALGGELGLESALGDGSLFWVRLPLPAVAEMPGPSQPPAEPALRRSSAALDILVVEDNEINRIVAREMLTAEGHRVAEACDGREGCDIARARRFDLILMDISMPRMDGIAATQAIRSEGGASAHVPIFALTANARPEETARFRAAGIDEVLTKPISRAALAAALAEVGGITAAPAAPAAPPDVDVAVLQDLGAGLGPGQLDRLLQAFVAEAEATVAELTGPSTASLDDATLIARIHKFAGSAAVFGARGLQTWLAELESLGKGGAGAEMRARLPELAARWHSARRDLETALPVETGS